MNVCNMRAKTMDGQWCVFTILDAPAVVGENSFVLLNRKFSPILRYDTLASGTGDGVFVGDVLRDERGEEWFVKYAAGFYATSKTMEDRRMLYDFGQSIVKRQATPEECLQYDIRQPAMRFRYRERVFTISDVLGSFQGCLVVMGVKQKVDLDEIQQDMVVTISARRVFLGDLYKGMPIVSGYGRCCVQTEFGLYDILKQKYIIRKSGGFI